MPRMDGTGPTGQGPMTGRGMGSCGSGRGSGCRGWGCGHRQNRCGWFSRFFRSPKNELEVLDNEEKILTEQLATVKAEKEALKVQK